MTERYGKRESYFLWDDQNEIGRFEKGECRELRILGEGLGAEIGGALLYKLHDFYYVPIHDQRGSVVSLIDVKLQQPKECYRYTAFGEELLPHTLSPWRFSSKRVDSSGLVYFGRRYYHPTLGRWTTTDPQGFEDGPNLYAYLHNDPLTDIDLYGLFSFTPLWEASKGFSKGVGLGAWDTATGLWDLGNYASYSAMNWSSAGYSALRGDSTALRAQSARFSQGFNTFSSALIEDPLGSAKGLLRAALPGIYAACSLPADATLAQRAEALGRASFDIGSIFCGARAASLASSINALRTSISVQKSAALLSHRFVWDNCKIIVGSSGVAIPNSRTVLEAGFRRAGFTTFETRSAGMGYILPNGNKIRIMQPTPYASFRASFTNCNDGPISPFTGKPIQFPRKTEKEIRSSLSRKLTHLDLIDD